MELSQKVDIPVAPAVVWRALIDPRVLGQCLPGCEEFESVEDGKYAFAMRTRVGPVNAQFKGEIEITNVVAPHSYTLVGTGKGGVAGFAKGSADVGLESVQAENGETHTRLTYTVNASVGGKLAQLGSRLVGGTARKLAIDFFNNFARVVTDGEDLEVVPRTIKQKD